MKLFALTGGIGSGKSSVANRLTALGAVIVDSDLIVRDLQRPGQPVLLAIVERFGAEVLAESGHLDRAALAGKVFADAEALAALNRIVHPAVGVEMMRRIDAQRKSQRVVVLDVPLLAESPRVGLGGVLVVDLDPQIALQRLVEQRGLSAQDAQARIAKQATRQQRRAIADWIIDNSGSRLELARQVGAAWQWMCSLPPAAPDAGRLVRSANS